jgi:hypothetical protein
LLVNRLTISIPTRGVVRGASGPLSPVRPTSRQRTDSTGLASDVSAVHVSPPGQGYMSPSNQQRLPASAVHQATPVPSRTSSHSSATSSQTGTGGPRRQLFPPSSQPGPSIAPVSQEPVLPVRGRQYRSTLRNPRGDGNCMFR